MDDQDLRNKILQELDWEPSVDSTGVGVMVDHGVVTLTGHVSTFAQKMKSEDVVKRMRGVRAIAQEIEVRPIQGIVRADDDIASRAINMLSWDVSTPEDAIQVKVEEGWLTLTGAVAWEYQRKAAEENMRKLSGVLGVTNMITIKPGVQVTDVKRRIEDALRRHAEVDADNIRISVLNGKVTLEGKVQTWREREVAETAIWSAPGVSSVDNRVVIG